MKAKGYDEIEFELVDRKTQSPVEIGASLETSRGEPYVLENARPPHRPNSGGKVFIKKSGYEKGRECFASVVGLENSSSPYRNYY